MSAGAGARRSAATGGRALGAALVLVSAGCAERGTERGGAGPAPGPAWFVDEAGARGLPFVYASGQRGRYLMPEIMGGGAALFDMDGDGDLDAYFVQGGDLASPRGSAPGNRLFRNRGDGTFEPVVDDGGAGDRGYGMGVAVGDVDADGDLDLYVTNFGPDVLLANDGAGRFTDVTADAGLGLPGWSASAAFLDHDRDGDLDLWVTGYLAWDATVELECFNTMGGEDYCSPRNYRAPAQDVLYRNDGQGRFTDVSAEVGLTSATGTGLGVVAADFDGDGWTDVFVANDGMPDQLWRNEGGERFVDRATAMSCAFDEHGRAAAGMGVAVADLDEDGDLDLFVGNLRNESDCVLRNEGGEIFSNVTAPLGLGATSRRFTRFGLGWHDFDRDGRLDLYQANGRVMRQADALGDDPYAEPGLLFRGTASGRFEEVLPRGGTAVPLVATSRGAAFGDVDGDGGIDVLVVNRDAPAHLLMNRVPHPGHWIALRCVDGTGLEADGARVRLEGAGRAQSREVRRAYSYLSANDAAVHFGLGAQTGPVEVRVVWPDGRSEGFGPLPVDRRHVLVRGTGRE